MGTKAKMELAGMIGLFAFCMAVIVSVVTWMAYSQWGSEGYDSKLERGIEAMAVAHENGQYAEVVRIYETPVHVPLYFDIHFQALTFSLPAADKVRVADSYERLGNRDAAVAVYLKVLEWSPSQYNAYCGLADDCGDISRLRALAQASGDAHDN